MLTRMSEDDVRIGIKEFGKKSIYDEYILVKYKGRKIPRYRAICLALGLDIRGMSIHHIDMNKHNDHPSNLYICTWNEHFDIHNGKIPLPTKSNIDTTGKDLDEILYTYMFIDVKQIQRDNSQIQDSFNEAGKDRGQRRWDASRASDRAFWNERLRPRV